MWWIVSAYFVLLWPAGESIVTNDGGSTSADKGSTNQLTSQESQQRSAVYGDYYPGDIHNSGGHYAYGYDHHDSYHPQPHYGHDHHYDVGLKSLLIPLAGVALLGAAALFASNPVLLQLGVVSGKRRRRSMPDEWKMEDQRLQDMLLLMKFINQLPKEEVLRQERRLLASYLHCSNSLCVERLTCELHSGNTSSHKTERNLIEMVISVIVDNEFIDKELKKNILRARTVGRSGGNCNLFSCPRMENNTNIVKY